MLEGREIEPLIKWVGRQFRARASLDLGRQRELRLDGSGTVATRKYRCEPAREVNAFPLIKFAMQLPERGKCVRQSFEVGDPFRLTFLHVLVAGRSWSTVGLWNSGRAAGF